MTKAIRFGINEIQPGQSLTNAERIASEMADLMQVFHMLHERGVLPFVDAAPMTAKGCKVEQFMCYAESVGALDRGEKL